MSLCRGKCTDAQTIIFAGNGSIQSIDNGDGWNVITNFLINDERINECIDPELFLLRCAEDLKFYIQHVINRLKETEEVHAETNNYGWMPGLLHDRYQVAQAYNADNFRIKTKPEFIEKLLKRDDTCVITSNWDTALWNDESILNLCHIHGRCDIAESLILPTETFSDSYCFLDDLNRMKEKIHDQKLVEFFKKRVAALEEAEKKAWDWVFSSKLDTIVLWGIHLHIYDSEIISKIMNLKRRTTDEMIFQATSGGSILSPIKKVYVVNPDKKALKRAGGIFAENLFEEKEFIMEHIDPTTGKVDINDISRI